MESLIRGFSCFCLDSETELDTGTHAVGSCCEGVLSELGTALACLLLLSEPGRRWFPKDTAQGTDSPPRAKVLTLVLELDKGCCVFYSIHRFATPKEMSSLSLLDHLFTSQSLGIEGKSSMCTVKVAAKHLIIGLERKS